MLATAVATAVAPAVGFLSLQHQHTGQHKQLLGFRCLQLPFPASRSVGKRDEVTAIKGCMATLNSATAVVLLWKLSFSSLLGMVEVGHCIFS